jgi:hypothetical protein
MFIVSLEDEAEAEPSLFAFAESKDIETIFLAEIHDKRAGFAEIMGTATVFRPFSVVQINILSSFLRGSHLFIKLRINR